ncbi:toll/interleukin-1 receptor domain-containing protein [bacterium]|nr:toll/interleukin-1 receptor domain-containing protein [bacterium]
MENSEFTYDIFISYAREDYAWVRDSLYTPLTQCLMPDGKRPKVFLDQSDMGVKPGENYLEALAKAIMNSHRVIIVYSRTFFSKSMTRWELTKALQADPTGKAGKINPILLEHEAKDQIPIIIDHIHYLDVQEQPDDWFPRLIHNIGLSVSRDIRLLEMTTQPSDTAINITLPPVSVALSDRGQAGFEEGIVELTADCEGLQGTLRQKTSGGTAVFPDISFRQPAGRVSLTAKAEGYQPATSAAFSVVETKKEEAAITGGGGRPQGVVVPAGDPPGESRVYFFESGKTFAVIDASAIRLYDRNGLALGRSAIHSRPKIVRSVGDRMVLAEWSGRLLFIRESGEIREVPPKPNEPTYAIPGNVVLAGGQMLVGMWNGDLLRLDPASGETALVFKHPAGILDFESDGHNVYIVDFQGGFTVYQGDRPDRQFPVEHSIAGMKCFRDHIVIIGEKKLYQFDVPNVIMTPWRSNLSNILHAMPLNDRIMALDDAGSGMFLDEQLLPRHKFHSTQGAVPFCAGSLGDDAYATFIYPDGTFALLKNSQIVYTHAGGTISFDPRMTALALGSPEGIRISDGSRLQALLGKA